MLSNILLKKNTVNIKTRNLKNVDIKDIKDNTNNIKQINNYFNQKDLKVLLKVRNKAKETTWIILQDT